MRLALSGIGQNVKTQIVKFYRVVNSFPRTQLLSTLLSVISIKYWSLSRRRQTLPLLSVRLPRITRLNNSSSKPCWTWKKPLDKTSIILIVILTSIHHIHNLHLLRKGNFLFHAWLSYEGNNTKCLTNVKIVITFPYQCWYIYVYDMWFPMTTYRSVLPKIWYKCIYIDLLVMERNYNDTFVRKKFRTVPDFFRLPHSSSFGWYNLNRWIAVVYVQNKLGKLQVLWHRDNKFWNSKRFSLHR